MKLFLTDLDGTLLNQEADVSSEVKDAIGRLRDHAYSVVLASGRHPDMMKYVASELKLDMPVVGCNGAVIKDLKQDEVLYIKAIADANVLKCYELAVAYDIPIWIYAEAGIYCLKASPRLEMMQEKNNGLSERDRFEIKQITSLSEVTSRIMKILFIFEEHMDLKSMFYKQLKVMEGITVYQSHHLLLDVMAEDVDKCNGIDYFRDKGYRHVVAIGDHDNDEKMIRQADVGIAMGNAQSHVKDSADYVTDSNVNDGFAKAVDQILG